MKVLSKHIENAVEQLSSLPSVGKRTALRLALHLLKKDEDEIRRFAQSFIQMKENILFCKCCGNISDQVICEICSNPARNHDEICIVEDIRDIMAIEETGSFKGIYHVLGGVISPMDGIGPNDLNIHSLIEKLHQGNVKEIIFALNATMEGDTTSFYLYKKIAVFDVFISALSRGVSVGTELQYADELTLGSSIINRTPFKLTV
ncbi:MAG: recombination protein RecR [Flavobacteriia bacterium]|nr:recombination protein RecR [Flavobacteriia bacterium]OJX39232.1 MAG: recombination protein RecR [Flavobacteriia bacterium 40-80]